MRDKICPSIRRMNYSLNMEKEQRNYEQISCFPQARNSLRFFMGLSRQMVLNYYELPGESSIRTVPDTQQNQTLAPYFKRVGKFFHQIDDKKDIVKPSTLSRQDK